MHAKIQELGKILHQPVEINIAISKPPERSFNGVLVFDAKNAADLILLKESEFQKVVVLQQQTPV